MLRTTPRCCPSKASLETPHVAATVYNAMHRVRAVRDRDQRNRSVQRK